jgi:uncharacterized membrane protein
MNPIKPTIKTEIFPLLMISLCCLLSFYFYAHFPERVPTHWDFNGNVNGWSSRAVGAFLIPGMLVGMYLLFLSLPYLDPKKERYAQFGKVYHIFKGLILVLLAVIYVFAGLAGLGYNINIGLWSPLLIGILFIAIGNYFGKIKMNWFMGIRTPWTLSNEEVWNKTHRLGGKLFMISGVVLALMPWYPEIWRLPLFVLVMVILIFGTLLYSYVLYRQEQSKKIYDGKNNEPPKS